MEKIQSDQKVEKYSKMNEANEKHIIRLNDLKQAYEYFSKKYEENQNRIYKLTSENAHFKKVIDWWNRVVLYKKVNLYAGIGLYKCYDESETFGWKKDYNELYNQLTFTPDNFKQKIEGFSIFQFTALTHESEICSEQIKNGMKAWEILVPPSE